MFVIHLAVCLDSMILPATIESAFLHHSLLRTYFVDGLLYGILLFITVTIVRLTRISGLYALSIVFSVVFFTSVFLPLLGAQSIDLTYRVLDQNVFVAGDIATFGIAYYVLSAGIWSIFAALGYLLVDRL